MSDEKTMIVTNKGRRTWPVKNAAGDLVRLEPMESVEMREIDALRLINGYPQDISPAGPATRSSANLERAEQSLRDRTANLDRREKALDEREEKIKAREEALGGESLQDEEKANSPDAENQPPSGELPRPKRGRPAKTEEKAD